MAEAWGTLIELIGLVLVSVFDAFLYWCAAAGWALPVVLAVGAVSMRRFGSEYLIACVTLLNLSALNGYFAAIWFGLDSAMLVFQSLIPFVVYAAGPAIWYGLQAYLDPLFRFRSSYLIHFLPGVAATLITAAYLYSHEVGLLPPDAPVSFTALLAIGFALSLVYGLVSLQRFWNIYQEDDGNDQATRYRHRFLWVMGTVFIVLGLTSYLVLIHQAISPLVPLAFSALLLTVNVSLYCRHPEMFQILLESIQSAPHRRTTLPQGVVTHLQNRLAELMEQEQTFTRADLSMPALAELADVTPHQLSEYLNFYVGSNFSRYLNGYRIEEVKKRLVSSPSKPILDIALECGFNTKSTFNAVFADITGMTPSAWRKSHRGAG